MQQAANYLCGFKDQKGIEIERVIELVIRSPLFQLMILKDEMRDTF
jgi:hypothetical protein